MSTADIAAAAPPTRIVPATTGARPLGWWGTVFLIATEGTLFALLLFAYFFLRSNVHPWPPKGLAKPELVKSGIRSVLLIGSSIPAALGERALKRDDLRRFRAYLVVTLVMAALFLAGHIQEYLDVSKKMTPTSHSYGSIFFTITGLHAIHLVIGMTVLVYLIVQSLRGRYDRGRSRTPVECGLLYWHFVDAVWIAVFSCLYLSERL